MRKLVIGLAMASTAIASPALARDGAWYVELDGGPMIVEDIEFDVGAQRVARAQGDVGVVGAHGAAIQRHAHQEDGAAVAPFRRTGRWRHVGLRDRAHHPVVLPEALVGEGVVRDAHDLASPDEAHGGAGHVPHGLQW